MHVIGYSMSFVAVNGGAFSESNESESNEENEKCHPSAGRVQKFTWD
jgi:hypothetical protein